MFENFGSIYDAMINLQEEAFSLDKEGVEDYNNFEREAEEEEKDFLPVADERADSEDDFDASYLNRLILKCKECNFMIYALKEEAIKESVEDESGEEEVIYNKNKECPHCKGTAGFTLVGVAAPYKATNVEVTVQNTETGETKVLNSDGEIKDFDIIKDDISTDECLEDLDGDFEEDFEGNTLFKESQEDEDGGDVDKAYKYFRKKFDEDFDKINVDNVSGKASLEGDGVKVDIKTTSNTKDDEVGVEPFDDSEISDATEDNTEESTDNNTEESTEDNTEESTEDNTEESTGGDESDFNEVELNDIQEESLQRAFVNAHPRYESYKVTGVYGSTAKNKIYVEGYAKTRTGRSVKESFTLLPKRMNRDRVSFIAEGFENPTVARGKIRGDNLIIESFYTKSKR